MPTSTPGRQQTGPTTESTYDRPDAEAPVLDPVQEASEESFPASDAPGWIGGHDLPHVPENPGPVTFRANKASDFMSTVVISIADDAPLQEAIVLLTDKGLHAAPVIDVTGRPVGVISPSDLLIHEREKRGGDTAPVLVRDVMTPGVIAVATDAPMHKVVEELRANQVRQVFVVDKAGVLVGSISALDVLKQLQFDCD